ncbi:MAG TPA: YceI family protein [Phnomibacter sp.]|nr:YceI family protein [Phnomibacter sp.]
MLIVLTNAFLGVTTAQTLRPANEASSVNFSIKNFGLWVKGSLSNLNGTINYNPENPLQTTAQITLDPSTINTGIAARDNHLRKPEYFDVANYQTISFVSTSVTATQTPGLYFMMGRLTIKGTTKQIGLAFTASPQHRGYLFKSDFTIQRTQFGIGGKSLAMADEVKINLHILAQ